MAAKAGLRTLDSRVLARGPGRLQGLNWSTGQDLRASQLLANPILLLPITCSQQCRVGRNARQGHDPDANDFRQPGQQSQQWLRLGVGGLVAPLQRLELSPDTGKIGQRPP